jgi:glycosyltransferase involved in cell wall biosynthesis
MSTLARHIDLSVVIPAYNEAQRLRPTLARVHAFLDRLAGGAMRYEILVVDDGSTDGTAEVADQLAEAIPQLRVIRSRPNRGKGAAVRVGMLEARGQVRVMCDADCSMPPEEMPKLLAHIGSGAAQIAIGSRYADGARVAAKQPLYRRLWSRLCNQVIQRSLVPGIRDTQCGFKAFTARAAQDLFARARIDGWAFDLEILALARRRGYAIAEVAVTWADDNRSRVNPWKDMVKVVREAIAIRRNLRLGVYGPLGRGGAIARPPGPARRAALISCSRI